MKKRFAKNCNRLWLALLGAVWVLGVGVLSSPGTVAGQTQDPPPAASVAAIMASPTVSATGTVSPSRVPLPEGASVPTLSLRDLEGQVATFPVAGHWNLVFFWSLFCHTCLDEVPLLASESTRFADLPCSTFFVSLDTVRMQKGLENYVKKRRLNCRILLEETVASTSYFAADQWGVSQTPTTFLVDPTGRVVFQRQGPFDQEELWGKLRESAAKGKAP